MLVLFATFLLGTASLIFEKLLDTIGYGIMVLFQEWHIMDHHGTSAHPVPDTVVQMLEAPLRDSRQGLHRLRVQ